MNKKPTGFQRIKAAFRTNEPQALSVMALTAVNLTLVGHHVLPPPLIAWVVGLLFWPSLAFLSNLHSPLPKED